MNSKTNPRKKQATQADVNKAFQRGINEGITSAIIIFFTVLLDKYGATADDLKNIWKHVNELSDSIEKGYVNIRDLERVLIEEYEVEVK